MNIAGQLYIMEQLVRDLMKLCGIRVISKENIRMYIETAMENNCPKYAR